VLYFSEVIRRGDCEIELSAFILIGPSKVPQHIADNEVWRQVMGSPAKKSSPSSCTPKILPLNKIRQRALRDSNPRPTD
jgi:hypothetical protein